MTLWRPNDDEIREELEFHRQERARLLQQHGVDAEESLDSARRRFGNELKWQEETRRVHVAAWWDGLTGDVRLAARSFARQPGFALAAIFTMALGIGAAAAAFSVIDPILFRPLPYHDPAKLVSLGMVAPIERDEFMLGADYYEWRQSRLPFSAMTTWSGVSECDLGGEKPRRLNCARVEWNFLSVFGVAPELGRHFRSDEDAPGAPKAALLSNSLWRAQFGADRSVVGRTFTLDGAPVRIVGVLPASLELPNLAAFDLMVPQALNPDGQKRPNTGAVLRSFARLRDGVTPSQAQQRMQPLFAASLQWVPAPFRKDVTFRVQSLKERQTRDAQQASWLLLATVSLVVLAACANLTSLLLMRGVARARELAVRMALGASRSQLARLVLVESCGLTIAGGVLGCLLAAALLATLKEATPEGFFRLVQARIDLRVLLCMFALSLVCGLTAGVFPAWRGGSLRPSHHRAGQWMVTAQVAASVALLALAASLGHAFLQLQTVPMGLSGDQVSVARVTLPRTYASPEQRRSFFDRLEARLTEIPGAVTALSDTMPPAGPARTMIYSLVEVEGRERRAEGTGGMVVWREVTPRFFETLRIPIVEGRGFTAEDQKPGQGVMILSRSLARRLASGQSLLGKRIQVGRSGVWREVVGISADVRNAGLAPTQDPEYYVPRPHVTPGYLEPNGRPPDAQRSGWILVRAAFGHEQAASWIERTVHELDSGLPVVVERLDRRIRLLSARERFQAVVMSALGAFTLALACLGIAGAIAFLVVRRTSEFGIRMALGALPAQLSLSMVRMAAVWLLWGVPLGLGFAWTMSKLLTAAAPGASARDLPASVLAVAAVAVAGLVTAWWQARAVARVDPAGVLRVSEER